RDRSGALPMAQGRLDNCRGEPGRVDAVRGHRGRRGRLFGGGAGQHGWHHHFEYGVGDGGGRGGSQFRSEGRAERVSDGDDRADRRGVFIGGNVHAGGGTAARRTREIPPGWHGGGRV